MWKTCLIAAAALMPLGPVARAGHTEFFGSYGTQSYDYFGTSVAAAGDVNDDGYPDVAIGIPGVSGVSRGAVHVLSGKDGSLIRNWIGPATDLNFGRAVAGAGDLNKDGYADILVGGVNIAWVISGQTGNIMWTSVLMSGGSYGWSVASAGDVDKDGYPDLIIGDPYSDAGTFNGGRVVVLSGKTLAILRDIPGGEIGASLGFSVSGAGDMDQDGYADILAGAPDAQVGSVHTGAAYVYSGKTGGQLASFHGTAGSNFGYSVAGRQDLDDDRHSDLLVGAPSLLAGTAGDAYCYSGKTKLLLRHWSGKDAGDGFGMAVSFAGDANRDFYDDVVIGAPFEGNSLFEYPPYLGAAHIFSGATGAQLDKIVGRYGHAHRFAAAVSYAGDLNGDGHGDIVIGDPLFDPPAGISFGGGVWVHSGQEYDASWSSYGAGWPGTNGVPSLALSADPTLCSHIQIDIGNSRGSPTIGTLFLGLDDTFLPTSMGGAFLVAPPWTAITLAIPGAGLALPVEVLCDTRVAGLSVYLQVLESDPGASQDVSFTKGLKLTHGM